MGSLVQDFIKAYQQLESEREDVNQAFRDLKAEYKDKIDVPSVEEALRIVKKLNTGKVEESDLSQALSDLGVQL